MGRPQVEQRVINGTSAIKKIINYSYNLDGTLATLSYPSGRTVTYAPSGAGRLISAQDTTSGNNYVTNVAYAPQGAIASWQSSSENSQK